mmetsp:Transcript_27809/g.77916  ORF Transcript_27809/g.77916 Transcript_27809/m.77916 type:complete len:395 (-) Transcript_27809:307-1491(-)
MFAAGRLIGRNVTIVVALLHDDDIPNPRHQACVQDMRLLFMLDTPVPFMLAINIPSIEIGGHESHAKEQVMVIGIQMHQRKHFDAIHHQKNGGGYGVHVVSYQFPELLQHHFVCRSQLWCCFPLPARLLFVTTSKEYSVYPACPQCQNSPKDSSTVPNLVLDAQNQTLIEFVPVNHRLVVVCFGSFFGHFSGVRKPRQQPMLRPFSPIIGQPSVGSCIQKHGFIGKVVGGIEGIVGCWMRDVQCGKVRKVVNVLIDEHGEEEYACPTDMATRAMELAVEVGKSGGRIWHGWHVSNKPGVFQWEPVIFIADVKIGDGVGCGHLSRRRSMPSSIATVRILRLGFGGTHPRLRCCCAVSRYWNDSNDDNRLVFFLIFHAAIVSFLRCLGVVALSRFP